MPTDWVDEQAVTDLDVRSNVASVPNAFGEGSGSIELWPNCYSEGADGIYDHDDVVEGDDCYGSFQIHNGSTTLMAWNGWSYGELDADIGVGNDDGETDSDWTHTFNAAHMTRVLEAYLVP